jgi:SET domain-containing protein
MSANDNRYTDTAIIVKTISENYRGLFANRLLRKDELIERAPIIEFCAAVSDHLKNTTCGEKFLAWRLDDYGGIISFAVGCGLLMLCNHSDQPNAIIKKDFDMGVIELYALNDIQDGDEICIRYFLRKTF